MRSSGESYIVFREDGSRHTKGDPSYTEHRNEETKTNK
jgi:hypothetical protein